MKKLIFTKHAAERLLERKIPLEAIERMLVKGLKIEEKETGAILCIYKEGPGKYYTLVIDEEENQITVITAYLSGKWQIEQYHKVKRR